MDLGADAGKDGADLGKKINWTLKTIKLADLTDYFKNPRQITEKEFNQLKKSLETFGMIDKPIVNADAANTIIGGHQRKHVLEASGVTECECWVPDRELTEREVEELNIRLNKNTGDWNFDVLANEWDMDDLLDWGFSENELGIASNPEMDELWQGMPEFNQQNEEGRTIVVHFETQEDVKAFAELIDQNITEKTRYLWFPEQERINGKAFQCRG